MNGASHTNASSASGLPKTTRYDVKEAFARNTSQATQMLKMPARPADPNKKPVIPSGEVLQKTTRYDVAASFQQQPAGFYNPATSAVVLRVIDGEFQGLILVLNEGLTTVGRALDCDHCLLEPTISRKHCIFALSESSLVVRDEGSVHGVMVKGELAQESPLQDGEILQLGSISMQVHIVQHHSIPRSVNVRQPGDHLKEIA